MAQSSFLAAIAAAKHKPLDAAVYLLWYESQSNPAAVRTVAWLTDQLEAAGYAKQNRARLATQLKRDLRTTSANGSFGVNVLRRPALDTLLTPYLKTKPAIASDSVVMQDLFTNAKKYTQKVVVQINASYDQGLFDCCAVMCRRLLETLIIEAYEEARHEGALKGADGNYMMFSGLLSAIEKNNQLNIGRSALDALKSFKKLGDLSAHSRRYNARQPDVDKVKDALRVASEELLHLANQA